jgi:hypothetical protein
LPETVDHVVEMFERVVAWGYLKLEFRPAIAP